MENKSDRGVYLRSENAKNAKCFYTVCSKIQLLVKKVNNLNY